MNLLIHHVIADIIGQSGTTHTATILGRRRNPAAPAELIAKHLPATKDTLCATMTSDYRNEHLIYKFKPIQLDSLWESKSLMWIPN
jgi:transposase